MKREKVEKKMIKHLKKINKIYKKYNPHGDYLGLSIVDGVYSINNKFWKEDRRAPIDLTVQEDKKMRIGSCVMCK